MNSEALGQQQLAAAWVTAGAAIVQAMGALGAIFMSLKIAGDAATRERESEQASIARAEQAEAVAAARIAEAEREAFNRAIDPIFPLVPPVMAELERLIETEAEKARTATGQIWAGFSSAQQAELSDMIERARAAIVDPATSKALANLAIASAAKDEGYGVSWDEYVRLLRSYHEQLGNAVEQLRSLRR